jgi:hypothetical protein
VSDANSPIHVARRARALASEMCPVRNPGLKQRVPAPGILRFRIERDRPLDEGTIALVDPAQAHCAVIAYPFTRLRKLRSKRQRLDAGIGQRMGLIGMGGEALPDPVAEIAKAPDRADLVAAPVILDQALGHTFDIGAIVVEVADQRPHGLQGMIEHGAVLAGCHVWLRELTGAMLSPPSPYTHPVCELRSSRWMPDPTPSPAPHRHCKPSHDPAEAQLPRP